MPDLRPTAWQSLQKLQNRVRARGPREVLDLGIDRVREAVGRRAALVVFSQVATRADAIEVEGLRFFPAAREDGDRYARDVGTDSPATFAARLSDTTMCFMVEADGLVHASWVTLSCAWTRELQAYLSPPAGDAYVYESFTHADARGRGIYPFALRNISTWLAARGVSRVWVAVEADNRPSLRAVTKAGFSEAFSISFSRRWGKVTIEGFAGPYAELGAGMVSERCAPRDPLRRYLDPL